MALLVVNDVVDGLDLDAIEGHLGLYGDCGYLRRDAGADALGLLDATALAQVAIGAVACGANDHGGEEAEERLELLARHARELAVHARLVRAAGGAMAGLIVAAGITIRRTMKKA